MKIMVTSLKRSHVYRHSPWPRSCGGSPPAHTFTRESWAPTGKSLMGSPFLSPGAWCTRFCLCPPRAFSQTCVSSGSSVVGLMVTSPKRAYAMPTSAAPSAPVPVADQRRLMPCPRLLHPVPRPCGRPAPTHAIPMSAAPSAPVPVADQRRLMLPQETLKHSSVSVSVGSLGPGTHKVCLILLSVSGGNGAWFQTWIRPSYHLAGASPCPWTLGISSRQLQRLPSYWGFSDLGREVSPHSWSREAQPVLLTLDMGSLFTAAPAKIK